MEFMAGYYRQKEDSASLLLQQYVCGGVPVFLGCICGGESCDAGMAGGQLTGRLLETFRGFSLVNVSGKRMKLLKKMERQVHKYWENGMVPPDFWTAGIMCIEESFLLFSWGEVKCILCNTGFGRPSLCEIGKDDRAEGLQLQWGSMEAGIGILLASESLYRNIPREDMQNCLSIRDIMDSGQTQKRLQELGRAAERRGGRGMAALLLEVR